MGGVEEEVEEKERKEEEEEKEMDKKEEDEKEDRRRRGWEGGGGGGGGMTERDALPATVTLLRATAWRVSAPGGAMWRFSLQALLGVPL